MKGTERTGKPLDIDYKADGSFTGTFMAYPQWPVGVFGTWDVKEDGVLCHAFLGGGRRVDVCDYWLRKDDEHFVAQSLHRRASARPIAYPK